MDTRLLEAILVQLAQISKRQEGISERLDKFILDLSEFGERFEEVVQSLEAERRLDLYRGMIFTYDDVIKMLNELPRKHVYAILETCDNTAEAVIESEADSSGDYVTSDAIDELCDKLENLKRGN